MRFLPSDRVDGIYARVEVRALEIDLVYSNSTNSFGSTKAVWLKDRPEMQAARTRTRSEQPACEMRQQ